MNLLESLRYLRERLNISQGSMIKKMSNTTYSRIENGQRNLKFETLQEISNRFDMTINEVLLFSDLDTEFQEYKKAMQDCLENIYDLTKKEQYLKKYYSKGDIHSLNIHELNYYLGTKAIFCKLWRDITPPTSNELDYLVNYLENKNFYTLADYRITVNTIIFFEDSQTTKIIEKMFPVECYDKRPDLLKSYARHTITNLISSLIYKLQYEKALYYVDYIEKQDSFDFDYYFRLIIAYHKNVALRFAERDLGYFDEARHIVSIIKKISDPLTGAQFETELNNLSLQADYYIDLVDYPRTVIKN